MGGAFDPFIIELENRAKALKKWSVYWGMSEEHCKLIRGYIPEPMMPYDLSFKNSQKMLKELEELTFGPEIPELVEKERKERGE